LVPRRTGSAFARRLFLEKLIDAHARRRLSFFGDLISLAAPTAFAAHLAPLRRAEWVVYAKPPFGGPAAVLAYLARYTHCVAISSSRLVSLDDQAVRFRGKDYRRANPATGAVKMATMALSPHEFIRRFLIHVLPSGFHRIRHYGLLAKGPNTVPLDALSALILNRPTQPAAMPEQAPEPREPKATPGLICPCCGGSLRIIEVIGRDDAWRARPLGPAWCDSS